MYALATRLIYYWMREVIRNVQFINSKSVLCLCFMFVISIFNIV